MKERKVREVNTSSDAAEQIVRISLEGFEVAARLSGSGAKNVAAALVAIAKDQQKVRGKTTLTNMLKSGRPLKVFSIKTEDLQKFSEEAKRYGVLFAAIVEKKHKDGMVDIMTKEEDASKINRIVERFKLATVDMATIESEIQKIKEEKAKGHEPVSEKTKMKKEEKQKPIKKEEQQNINPTLGKVNENQLEPSSKSKKSLEVSTRKSVREEIKEIKKEMNNKVTEHKHVKSKERGTSR